MKKAFLFLCLGLLSGLPAFADEQEDEVITRPVEVVSAEEPPSVAPEVNSEVDKLQSELEIPPPESLDDAVTTKKAPGKATHKNRIAKGKSAKKKKSVKASRKTEARTHRKSKKIANR